MDIVDRLFELVDAKYKEQKDFALELGVHPTRVSEWRKRKSASYQKRLPQIAEVLATTTEYLLTGRDPGAPIIVFPDTSEPSSTEGNPGDALRDAVIGKGLIPSGTGLSIYPSSVHKILGISEEALAVAQSFDQADDKSRAMVRLALGLDEDTAIAARGGKTVKKPSPASAETLDELSRATEEAAKKENDNY